MQKPDERGEQTYWKKHAKFAKTLSARQGTGSSALSGTDSGKEAARRTKMKSQWPVSLEKAKCIAKDRASSLLGIETAVHGGA